MENNGRKIAILTDIHALYEPTLAILDDIKKRGITEIYCLGDIVGLGPDPDEVINLLRDNNVFCIAGEDEEYLRLGFEPFNYISESTVANYMWTLNKISNDNIDFIYKLPSSLDIFLDNKKIALCHFGNDVRFDYSFHNVWTYKSYYSRGIGYKQFLYTNSIEQKDEKLYRLRRLGVDNLKAKGILAAIADPLFKGDNICVYDAMIEGHVHSKMYEFGENVEFYSLNGVSSFHYDDFVTSYYIFEVSNNDICAKEILLPFDVSSMQQKVKKMTMPNSYPIKMMTRM